MIATLPRVRLPSFDIKPSVFAPKEDGTRSIPSRGGLIDIGSVDMTAVGRIGIDADICRLLRSTPLIVYAGKEIVTR